MAVMHSSSPPQKQRRGDRRESPPKAVTRRGISFWSAPQAERSACLYGVHVHVVGVIAADRLQERERQVPISPYVRGARAGLEVVVPQQPVELGIELGVTIDLVRKHC